MADSVYTAEDAAYWYVPLARAVPAAALACVITFAGGRYSPEFGLITFGAFAVLSGLIALILTVRVVPRGPVRTVFVVQSALALIAGGVALGNTGGGLPVFLLSVGLWAAITGFLELYLGISNRRRRTSSRDWTFVGALTIVLAIVALVIPPDYIQHYLGPDHLTHILNTSVMVVGSLGVYGAIVAVYLVIAALSLRWGSASSSQNGMAS